MVGAHWSNSVGPVENSRLRSPAPVARARPAAAARLRPHPCRCTTALAARCAALTSGPISTADCAPARRSSRARPLEQPRDQRIGAVAHGNGHGNGHAALAGRAVGGADAAHRPPGPCRHRASRPCGSWRHPAPARACRRHRGVVHMSRPRASNPRTKPQRTAGMREQCVHGLAITLHHVEHAIRQARLAAAAGQHQAGDGSRSDGLSTKVLPQARASGNIHIGTITGKLNGVMPTATPSGCRRFQLSMPPPTLSECRPDSSRGDAAGELHDLDAAGHFAHRRRRAPCRARAVMAAASHRGSACSNSRNRNRTRARRSGECLRPGRERRRCRGHCLVHQVGSGEPHVAR